jgi:hypothetical protein
MSKKHWYLLATAVRVFALLLVIVLFLRSRKGLGDMAGRWEVDLALDGAGESVRVTWMVGDLAPDPDQADRYLANGCMQTEDSGKQAPLALEAVYHPELDRYTLTIYSTLIPADDDSFIVRFESETLAFGTHVAKSKASGVFVSDLAAGAWSAVQRDGRLHSCEGVLVMEGEDAAHMDFDLEPGGSISGIVVSGQGSPLAGASVLACEYEGGYCLDVVTPADGEYTLEGLPAGDYRVLATVEGQAGVYFDDTDDPGLAARVTVRVGIDTTGIDFTLR